MHKLMGFTVSSMNFYHPRSSLMPTSNQFSLPIGNLFFDFQCKRLVLCVLRLAFFISLLSLE